MPLIRDESTFCLASVGQHELSIQQINNVVYVCIYVLFLYMQIVIRFLHALDFQICFYSCFIPQLQQDCWQAPIEFLIVDRLSSNKTIVDRLSSNKTIVGMLYTDFIGFSVVKLWINHVRKDEYNHWHLEKLFILSAFLTPWWRPLNFFVIN